MSELFGVSTDYLMKGLEIINKPMQINDIVHNPAIKKYTWLIAIPIGFLLCYIIWQMGQVIGDDIGEFIYNIMN